MSYSSVTEELYESARWEPIRVLVWGPGDPGPTAPSELQKRYAKRRQIRDEIKSRFERAEVYFSEDPELDATTARLRGALVKEAVQAKASHLVIMLDVSRGADLELDHFVPTYPWFRDKVRVFLPEQYIPPSGLAKEVFDYLRPDQVEGFTQDEFDKCDVATKKAIDAALQAAVMHRLRT